MTVAPGASAQRLHRAEAVLNGSVAVPAEQRLVAAAHLARTALETAVADALHSRGLGRARVTSRLIVLDAPSGAAVGALARLAWTGLSRACHRHAFELPPAESEVRTLIGDVRTVIERI